MKANLKSQTVTSNGKSDLLETKYLQYIANPPKRSEAARRWLLAVAPDAPEQLLRVAQCVTDGGYAVTP